MPPFVQRHVETPFGYVGGGAHHVRNGEGQASHQREPAQRAMRTAAAVIPSQGTIGKEGMGKKARDVSMRTLRNGSRSDLSMMGIRTPTQYLVSEFVTARKGGPGPMDRKENGSWFLGCGEVAPEPTAVPARRRRPPARHPDIDLSRQGRSRPRQLLTGIPIQKKSDPVLG